jgi:hypothetical protein
LRRQPMAMSPSCWTRRGISSASKQAQPHWIAVSLRTICAQVYGIWVKWHPQGRPGA